MTSIQAAEDRWREAGLPYIKKYSTIEYQGGEQNWDIAQDRRGVMYFANGDGLLEYDGVSWRQIHPGVRMPVKSVGIDANGRVWVGAAREFGCLTPDSIGCLQYRSLIDSIPVQHRKKETYWRVALTSQDVFLYSDHVLIRWSDRQRGIKSWRLESFSGVFVLNDVLYVCDPGVGLMRMQGDSLHLVADGEKLAHKAVQFLLPYTGSNITSYSTPERFGDLVPGKKHNIAGGPLLVATSKHGFFLYDGVSFQPFNTEADAYWLQNDVLCGTMLADGNYALGTRLGGLVIITRRGDLRFILNKATGLPDNTVYQVYLDSQGGLWLALNKGLARIEFPGPITRYTQPPALQSGVAMILRHQDRLYVSTSEGVYTLQPPSSPGAPAVFQAVAGLRAQCGHLLSANEQLLATTNTGIYQIDNNRATLLKEVGPPLYFLRSRYDSSRVYVGMQNGLGLLQLQARRWKFSGYVPGIHESIEGLTEAGRDSLWLTTRFGDAILLSAPSLQVSTLFDSAARKIERFGQAHGLARGWIGVVNVNGKILFTTNKGLRRFDPVSRTFPLAGSFGGVFADSTWDIGDGRFFHLDDQGRVWTSRFRNNQTEVGVAVPEPDGSYSWRPTPFRRFADFGEIWAFYIDPLYEGVYWFGGSPGIVRYDETIAKDCKAAYTVLVRRVIVNGDSVIYGGAFNDPVSSMPVPTLPFANNTLQIEYAAPYFDNEAANRYQYFPEGFDDGWSGWTGETTAAYRNLPEGHYRFHVRARNIYQSAGDESVFAFNILPPWYRTWWSYVLYALMVFGALYGIRHYELNRQQHKYQVELERVAAGKLKELDKLKSDFFANISHEFRTPLTLILGPTEQMLEKQTGGDKKNLSLIRRNAQRLLQLIDQLLDLSKLERGNLKLQVSPGDFLTFLKGLVMSFESLAERQGIELHFEAKDARQHGEGAETPFDQTTYFDRDKIEKIFTNLLSNAFKFTPEGGTVRVIVSLHSDCPLSTTATGDGYAYKIIHPKCQVCLDEADQKKRQGTPLQVNCCKVTISDTGEGIPAEQLPYIFDRFYQVDSSSRRIHGGTGIGLALVKELVDLHYGSITVASREGSGTRFTVSLPLGRDHLLPEQIVNAAISHPSTTISVQYPEIDVLEQLRQPESRDEEPMPDGRQLKIDRPIILIIEDNADVRAYIREQLQTEYDILEAIDGEAGIAQAIEAIPDLVISDVMMPKKDGFEVCRTLKTDERTSHIPVILLTAKAREGEKLAGLETGADDYILKPFRQQELAVRVRNLIALRRKLRAKYSTATVIKPSEVEATSMDRMFLKKVIAIIEKQFEEQAFNAEALASAAAMSVSQLNRKLNALIGQPAGQMIRSMRLQRAADLLAKKSGNVAEIGYAVGFSDQANFTRSFKKQFGCSPSEYQKTHKE